MKVTVRLNNKNAQAMLKRFAGELRPKVRDALVRGLKQEAANLKPVLRDHVNRRLKVARRSFLSGFYTRVYSDKPNRLPALYVGSKIPWVGIHERGGIISGRLLIPLYGRVGRKRFKAYVTDLIRSGNAYFVKNEKGNIVLMAENIRENKKPLAGFKRRYRQAEGIKRLKNGQDIPIAVLVPRVTLKSRLSIIGLVLAELPRIVSSLNNILSNLH